MALPSRPQPRERASSEERSPRRGRRAGGGGGAGRARRGCGRRSTSSTRGGSGSPAAAGGRTCECRPRSGPCRPVSMTRQARSTPSWTKRNSAGQPPTSSKTRARHRHRALPHGGDLARALRRARARAAATSPATAARPRDGSTRSCTSPAPRAARPSARERVVVDDLRVVVEEEQQVALDRRDARRCGRPGSRRPPSGRRPSRPRGSPSGSQPFPTTTTSTSTPRCRRSDCTAPVEHLRAAALREDDGAPAASSQPLRREDRQQVPERGDRRDRDEHDQQLALDVEQRRRRARAS